MAADLLERARRWVGQPARTELVGENPVNLAQISRWTAAMGDANPAYRGEDAIAPPAMLDVWTMTPYRPGGRSDEDNIGVLKLFDEAGYTGVVATDVEQEYDRYLKPGDEVRAHVVVDEVSDEKRTGLGVGHFVTLRYEFEDAAGTPVGRMIFRVLKFRPPPPAAKSGGESGSKQFPHPRPAITHDNAHFWQGVDEHRLLIQKCGGCGRLRHPPAPSCSECGSLEWSTVQANGKGKVHSFVIMHEPRLPAFEYPLPILLVELDEGVRMIAHSDTIAPDAVEIGARVEAHFVEVEEGLVLPCFRRAQ